MGVTSASRPIITPGMQMPEDGMADLRYLATISVALTDRVFPERPGTAGCPR